MKHMIKAVLLCAGLAAGIPQAKAQTNLEYWTEQLNISLTGLTNGVPQTNGIVARVRAVSIRITSKEIIQALQNKPVFAISKGIATNFFATNAFPILTSTNAAYSSAAKLMLLQPLGTNDLSSLLVIRDQQPPVDYEVSAYFHLGKESFDGRANNLVSQGRLDLVHDLAMTVDYGIERMVFDDNAVSASPPPGTYFDVQGFTREQQFSLTRGDQVLGHHLTKAAATQVAGTGQVGSAEGFTVLRGTIALSGGRHEFK